MAGSETIQYLMQALQATSSVGQGVVDRNAANYDAKALDQEAGIARANAGYDEARIRRAGAQEIAEQVATVGQSGILLEGSPQDVLRQNATNNELDALAERYRGETQAVGFESKAKAMRAQGEQSFAAGVTSAGMGLLVNDYERRRRINAQLGIG